MFHQNSFKMNKLKESIILIDLPSFQLFGLTIPPSYDHIE